MYMVMFGVDEIEPFSFNFNWQRIRSTNYLVNIGDALIVFIVMALIFLVTFVLARTC